MHVGAPNHVFIIGELQLGCFMCKATGKLVTPLTLCAGGHHLCPPAAPGPPIRLVFPEVRLTSVRIVWQPPEEPNGIILGKEPGGEGGEQRSCGRWVFLLLAHWVRNHA